MTARRPVVAVVGPGDVTDELLLSAAYDVGAGVAHLGAALVTGGLGGVMAAASRGAADAGGLVVALLPGTSHADANAWAQLVLPTGLGEARNALVAAAADVVVAVGGSWGTLSEVALARRRGTPVVTVHGWQVDGPQPGDEVIVAADAGAAVRAAASLLPS